MVVVKVEIWKKGNPRDVEEISTVIIGNDETGNDEFGSYRVREEGCADCVKVEQYPRAEGVKPLVAQALCKLWIRHKQDPYKF